MSPNNRKKHSKATLNRTPTSSAEVNAYLYISVPFRGSSAEWSRRFEKALRVTVNFVQTHQELPRLSRLVTLANASALMALGSLFLLTWSLMVWLVPLSLNSLITLVLLILVTYVGVLIHVYAWLLLRKASSDIPSARWVFRIGLLTVTFALLSLPWTSPAFFFPRGRAWSVDILVVIVFGFAAYIPSVFGPVVFVESFLLARITTGLQRPLAASLMAAGIISLFALATIGVVFQMLFFSTSFLPPWFLIFAGLTSLGYALVAGALRIEGSPTALPAIRT